MSRSLRASLGWTALGASFALHASIAYAVGTYGHGTASVPVAGDTLIAVDVTTTDDTVPAPAPPPEIPQPKVTPAEHDTTTDDATKVRAATIRTSDATPAPAATPDTTPAAAADVATAADDEMPHFAMVIGGAQTSAGGRSAVDGGAAPGASAAPPKIADTNGVDELAKLISGPLPIYPKEAQADGIEADVPLDIVVDASGHVTEVRPTKHFGHGLDEAAATAIRTWKFVPARRGGQPVPVRVRWSVSFRVFE